MMMVAAATMMIVTAVAVVAAACVAMISMRNGCGGRFVTTSCSTRRQT